MQLGIPFDGGIEINPKLDSSTLPKAEKVALKISDLGEAMENVDAFARVIRVFEMNEFLRDGEKRKVVNFLIGDGSGQVRATAWNNLADLANKLEAEELIKIEGAYTKKGQKDKAKPLLDKVFQIDGPDSFWGKKAAEIKI